MQRMSVFGVGLVIGAIVILAETGDPRPLLAADKEKTSLPGNAAWDVQSFSTFFRVMKTAYDARRKELRWFLETREGMRTIDFRKEIDSRPFVFSFYDEDMVEIARIRITTAQLRGIPQDRIMKKGTVLETTLDIPDVMDKTVKVILRRGSRD